MRDVQTDERTAFAFDMYQACTEQLLQWVYPPLYPVHDTSTPWGKPDESGRCVPTYRLLLSSINFPHAEPLSPFIAHYTRMLSCMLLLSSMTIRMCPNFKGATGSNTIESLALSPVLINMYVLQWDVYPSTESVKMSLQSCT